MPPGRRHRRSDSSGSDSSAASGDSRDSKGNKVSNKTMDKANNRTAANKAVSRANRNNKTKVGIPKMVKINNNRVKPKMGNRDNKVLNRTLNKVSNWIIKTKMAMLITMVTAFPMT